MPVSTRGPLGCSSASQSEVKVGGDALRFDVNANAPWTPGVPGQALVFRLSPDPKNRYSFGPSFTPPITPSTGPNLNPSVSRAPSGKTTTPGPVVMVTFDANAGSTVAAMANTTAIARSSTLLLSKKPRRLRMPIASCQIVWTSILCDASSAMTGDDAASTWYPIVTRWVLHALQVSERAHPDDEPRRAARSCGRSCRTSSAA